MFLKSLSIFAVLIFLSISANSQVVGFNDYLPLMYNNFNNVSTANATDLGISSRNSSAFVINPATAAIDDYTSFSLNFSGLINTIRYDDLEINNNDFGLNSINALISAGTIGNFFVSFSNNFSSNFYNSDEASGTVYDVKGSVSKATGGWAMSMYGISAGFSLSKNMGSYRSMRILSDSNWDPIMIKDSRIDFSRNTVDQYSIGFTFDFSEKGAFGVNYQSKETISLIENSKTAAVGDNNRIWEIDSKEIERDLELDPLIFVGGFYKIEDYVIALDGGGDFMEDNSFLTASLGVTYNGLKNSMPVYSTLRYNSFDRFGIEYIELIGKIGSSYMLKKDAGKLDFSAGPVYRKSEDGFREIAVYTGVSITGFSKWGN